jgi:hypothetical protein
VLSLFSAGVHAPERLIPVERIRNLLRQPGGVTMTFMVESLRAPRDIISNDLETMRDYLGFPVCWDPGTGTYRLGKGPEAGQPRPEGVDLALLYRAIALEEYLYVTVTTGSGIQKRIHALPGKVKKVRGRRQVKLRERSGAWRVVDLEAIQEVKEAFGVNK